MPANCSAGDRLQPKDAQEALTCSTYLDCVKGVDNLPLWSIRVTGGSYAKLEYEILDPLGKAIATCSCFALAQMKAYVAPKKATAPKLTLNDVILSDSQREAIRVTLAGEQYLSLIMEEWGLGSVLEKGRALSMLFYGPPGTGKTLTAQAIADEFGRELMKLSTAQLESSVPGEFERTVAQKFQEAQQSKAVLLFDECDSLICNREEVGIILSGQINALLTALENHEGIVIFTTNRLGRMDPAMDRRIALKLEFPFPDEGQRAQIWRRLCPPKLPLAPDVTMERLARFPLAGGHIKNCLLTAVRRAAYQKAPKITEEHLATAIQQEMKGIREMEAARQADPRRPRLVDGRFNDLRRG